jgi:hypothetical protein
VLVLFWIGAAIILKSCFGRHFEKGFHHPHFQEFGFELLDEDSHPPSPRFDHGRICNFG